MGISSLHLDAFFAAARSLNFSQAAKELHITQSALSQRIKALEEDLNLTFFVRMPRGVQLTETGERLLRYCQARNSLEAELLEELTGRSDRGLGGVLRIAGYSSVVRSVLLPALAPLVRENPNVQVHLQNGEMRQLPEMLMTGVVDFIVTDTEIHRAELESVPLGQEHYVLIESADHAIEHEVFLDHDPDDRITQQFLSTQSGQVPPYRRSFMDEIYAILDSVALGLGKAVVSRHLVVGDERLRIVDGYRAMTVPVMLYHHRQPFYTALHERVIAQLAAACPALLRADA